MSIFKRDHLRDDLHALVDRYPRAGFYGRIWRQINDALRPDEVAVAVAAGASGAVLTTRRVVQVRGAGKNDDVLALGLDDVRMVQVDGHGRAASVAIRTDGPRVLVRTIMREPADAFAEHVREAAGL